MGISAPPKKLVILGAGFSCPMGLPGMNDILTTFRRLKWPRSHKDWTINGTTIMEQEAARVTFDHWASIDPNVEAYGKHLFERYGPSSFELKRFCSVFVRGLELAMQQNRSCLLRKVYWKNIYKFFAEDIAVREHILVATYNQDLLVDQALMATGFCPDYFLDSLDTEPINACTGKKVRLLKPNGSLNWYVCDLPFDLCSKITYKWDHPTRHLPANWGTGRERHCHHGSRPDIESDLHFLMVPPGMKDQGSFTKLNQVMRVRNLLHDAANSAEEIYFIGWSAPETDEEWAGQIFRNVGAQFHVVDYEKCPDLQRELKRRYCKLLGKLDTEIEWYLGPARGDVTNYRKSEWREKLLA